ncbi:MAG: hypothetical protein K5696_10365 [Lachnospiraceae bacterium]|nr:hypothetical protein [Lachnospiraceae bacterium]
MSVNGITSGVSSSAYTSQTAAASQASKADPAGKAAESAAAGETAAATYEGSVETKQAGYSKIQRMSEEERNKIAEQLKSDQEQRQAQMVDLVSKMMRGQGVTYNNANDIWSFLREGNFEVDAATKAQAQQDISEDGYWGVKQTSQRILDFADALAGSDPKNIQKMYDAFKKGYKQAEDTWGGELPDISKQTYESVLDGFRKRAEEAGVTLNED